MSLGSLNGEVFKVGNSLDVLLRSNAELLSDLFNTLNQLVKVGTDGIPVIDLLALSMALIMVSISSKACPWLVDHTLGLVFRLGFGVTLSAL